MVEADMPTEEEVLAAQQQAAMQQTPGRFSYDDLPPRNPQEYANKILTVRNRERFPELNEDLILSDLDPNSRDYAESVLDAHYAIKALDDYGGLPKNSVLLNIYNLKYSFRVDSSRAAGGRTLDAFTTQRTIQEMKHKQEIQQGNKSVIRRFF